MRVLVEYSLTRLDCVKVPVMRCVVRIDVQALLVDAIAGPLPGVV